MKRPFYQVIHSAMIILVCLVLVSCGQRSQFPPTSVLATPTRTLADLGWIAFTARHPNGLIDIYKMRADGTNWVNLTNNTTGQFLACPRWSPDGKQIAFWVDEGDAFTLKLMDAEGNNVRRIMTVTNGAYCPSWSPDGKRMVYGLFTSPVKSSIWVIELETLQTFNLTHDEANDGAPAWSPDGKKVIFTSDRAGANLADQIFVMDSEGTHIKQLTDESVGAEGPAWSSDGNKIVYMCRDARGPEICVINADGSRRTQLIHYEDFRSGYYPSWSPDGLRIVYGDSHTDMTNLYVMDADGSNVIQLTEIAKAGMTAVGDPVWQPIPQK